ncbi:MAG: hypothetical protein WCP26_06870 [Actinomycetes bacterium]
MTDDSLEQLPYPELRDRAFHKAERRLDAKFFLTLMAHTQAMDEMADEGGSLGDASVSIIDSVKSAREAFTDEPGDLEPLFRAVFVDYLTRHPD